MKVLASIFLALAAGLTGACASSPYAPDSAAAAPPDGISRNIGESQPGTLRSPSALNPPPVDPGYVRER